MAEQEELQPPIRQMNTLAKYADQVPDLIDKSKDIPPSLMMRDVTSKLAATTSIPERDIRDIFTALEQLRSAAETTHSIDAALDRFIAYFGSSHLTAVSSKRSQIKAAVELLGGDHPAVLTQKARKLAFLRENLLQDAEIVTDARPVYSENGRDIVRWVITHSLVITYQHYGETSRTIFSMDAEDVNQVRNQCDRATIKAATLQKEFGDKAIIVGDKVRTIADG